MRYDIQRAPNGNFIFVSGTIGVDITAADSLYPEIKYEAIAQLVASIFLRNNSLQDLALLNGEAKQFIQDGIVSMGNVR